MHINSSTNFSAMPMARSFSSQLFGELDSSYDDIVSGAVLPEQFYSAPTFSSVQPGHLVLRWAVLKDALDSFTRYSQKEGRRAQRLARETAQWFFTDDSQWPFSFINICAVLGLDPSYIRRCLLRAPQGSLADRPRRRHYTGRRSLPLAA